MSPDQNPFWQTKSFKEMTEEEWDSLCCRCGVCCLHRLKNRKTGKTYFTTIACRYLDLGTCHCAVYEKRFDTETDCEKMTPDNVMKLRWLPKACGYRTVAEARDLDWWHPFVSENPDTVHQAGFSVRNKVISEDDIIAGDLLKYLIMRPNTVPVG